MTRIPILAGFARRLPALLPALLAVGCATMSDVDGGAGDHVALAPGVTFEVPPPASLGRRIDVVQRVDARHGSDAFSFEGRLSVTPEEMLLVGVDGMGRRIMTVTWAHGAITAERAAWVPGDLRPENVVADMVLLFWPETAVRQGLAKSGASLMVDRHGRAVVAKGRRVVAISYEGDDPWSGVSTLRNEAWGYELEIRSEVVGP